MNLKCFYCILFIWAYPEALNNYDIMWNIARDAPRMIVQHHDERAVQMIDEFQLLI